MNDTTEQGAGERMTLVGHLDELRRRIVYALVGLAGGIAAALMLGRQIVNFLRYPYTRAMEAANQQADPRDP